MQKVRETLSGPIFNFINHYVTIDEIEILLKFKETLSEPISNLINHYVTIDEIEIL